MCIYLVVISDNFCALLLLYVYYSIESSQEAMANNCFARHLCCQMYLSIGLSNVKLNQSNSYSSLSDLPYEATS